MMMDELSEIFDDDLTKEFDDETTEDFDDEMYHFVFHFMPWFVYNLKPERKFLLDDEDYIELNCPCGFELYKQEIGDVSCRIVSFKETSFAGMEVPMCMIVTTNNDEKLLGYFTIEKEDFLGYVLCMVEENEVHSMLNQVKWQELPSKEQFATDVVNKYIVRK